MKVQIPYTERMISWIKDVLGYLESNPNHTRRKERMAECFSLADLDYDYLRRVVSGEMKETTLRVMNSLGMELYFKDPATGEFVKLETTARCNPRSQELVQRVNFFRKHGVYPPEIYSSSE
jgi:hypothetical protein